MLSWVQHLQNELRIQMLRLSGLAGEFSMRYLCHDGVGVELKNFLVHAQVDCRSWV